MKERSLEETWRATAKEARLPSSWLESPLRRFVHFEAAPCRACRRITQSPPCARCGGSGFEPMKELERAWPASIGACTFFAREAARLTVVEDAVREQASAATQRVRWKTATERAWGLRPAGSFEAPLLELLESAAVVVESVGQGALTLVACGVRCACVDADWQRRPAHVTRWLGFDAHAEVSVETCVCCGATWLEYFSEDHHGNGSRYRGLISAQLAREVTAETAAELLARLPWYWLGGSYFFGQTSRSSGPVRPG